MCLFRQNVLTWDSFKPGPLEAFALMTGFVLLRVIGVSVLTECTDLGMTVA